MKKKKSLNLLLIVGDEKHRKYEILYKICDWQNRVWFEFEYEIDVAVTLNYALKMGICSFVDPFLDQNVV